MAQVIVLASGKGGTGKSTVSVSLAVALVKREKKVLLIDCDSGMRGLDLMLGIEGHMLFDAGDVVMGNCEMSEAVYAHPKISGLYLLPSPLEAENEISPSVLKEIVDSQRDSYDYIIIDSPAGTGRGFEAAMEGADRALIVVNAEPTSVRGCVNIRRKLVKKGITDIRLVINRFNEKAFWKLNIYPDLDALIDMCQTQLIALVPEDYSIVSVIQNGKSGLYHTSGEVLFDCLAGRVMGENIPLAFDGKKGR
ncbi:MAG: AAA family ATPase [Acutalibacteraceae bacterium]